MATITINKRIVILVGLSAVGFWLINLILLINKFQVDDNDNNVLHLRHSSSVLAHFDPPTNSSNPQPLNTYNQNCAIILFGLPRQFNNIVLPSIKHHLVQKNQNCDIFLHTFNASFINNQNPNNLEYNTPLNLTEVYLLQEAKIIKIEDADNYYQRQKNENMVDTFNENITYYRQYYPEYAGGWAYPTSIDNMLKQWHSIAAGWSLMVQHEHFLMNTYNSDFKYNCVGFFRSDVLYTGPIDLSVCKDGSLVVPRFNHEPEFNWMNDRMIWGSREDVKVWALERFPHVPEYVATDYGKDWLLHSEHFLYHLIYEKFSNISIDLSDVCFNRVRATGNILMDCEDVSPHSNAVTNNYIENRGDCALLFHGLADRSYSSIVLPSTEIHILDLNSSCDIYAYGIIPDENTTVTLFQGYQKKAIEILATDEEIEEELRYNEYYQYFPDWRTDWENPNSLKLMLRDWYAKEQLWTMMNMGEKARNNGTKYSRVGVFNLNIIYSNDTDINEDDLVLSCHSDRSINDAAIYGLRNMVEKMIMGRFNYVTRYMKSDVGMKYKLSPEEFFRSFIYENPLYASNPLEPELKSLTIYDSKECCSELY